MDTPGRIIHYRNFDIVVSGQSGAYTVQAITPRGARTPSEPCTWPHDPDIETRLTEIRAAGSVPAESLADLGTQLFDALFTRRIGRAHAAARAELPPDQQLRLRLVVQPPELSVLPWELIYDPDDGVYLASRHSSPLVRYLETGRAFEAASLYRVQTPAEATRRAIARIRMIQEWNS